MTFDEWWKKETGDNENNVDDWKGFCKTAFETGQKEIKQLGERCNQLLKDKGDLTDKIADIKANCDFVLEGKDVEINELRDNYEQYKAVAEPTIKELEQKLEQTEKDLADYQFNYPTIKELEKENAKLRDKLNRIERKCKFNFVDLLHDVENESKQEDQLIKATELLKEAQGYIENIDDVLYDEIEQFLREVDICDAIQQTNDSLDLDKIADEIEQDLNEGCPDILCEDCSKEDCTVRKLGLVPTNEDIETIDKE